MCWESWRMQKSSFAAGWPRFLKAQVVSSLPGVPLPPVGGDRLREVGGVTSWLSALGLWGRYSEEFHCVSPPARHVHNSEHLLHLRSPPICAWPGGIACLDTGSISIATKWDIVGFVARSEITSRRLLPCPEDTEVP